MAVEAIGRRAPAVPQVARPVRLPLTEPTPVRWVLVAAALAFLLFFLVLPFLVVFTEALAKGVGVYVAAITEPDALAAIELTLLTAAIAVPLNLAFGVAAAWAITKFEFNGKSLLITLIDLPFSVSPVISGMVFILLFGLKGWFGHREAAHGLRLV